MWKHFAILAAFLSGGSVLAQPASQLNLPYTLTKPAGEGPFPAVVIAHDCSGLGPRSSGSPGRWATRLNAAGYVTIAVDSFTMRGHPEGVCTDPSPPVVTLIERGRDTYLALNFLQSQPFVDPKRIALIGGSHGGATTLTTMVDTPLAPRRVAPGFVGAVALYPACGRTTGDWKVARDPQQPHRITGYEGAYKPRAPLLILIGELDDWTPAEPCRRMAEAARQKGFPVDIVTYSGAHHSFDSAAPLRFVAERVNQNVPGGRGATTTGNPAAWTDAVRRVLAFFAEVTAAPK